MKALIIEGVKDKSEYSFWERMLAALGLSEEVALCDAQSCSCISAVLEELLCKQQYEKLIVCFDTTANRNKLKKYLDETAAVLIRNRAFDKVSICEFYSFEDCILLFRLFEEWVYAPNSCGPYYQQILQEYQSLGTEISDEWSEQYHLSGLLDFAKRVHIKKADSRESLAGAVVRELTKNTHFKVDKGTVSECWTNSCRPPEGCSTAKIPCGVEQRHLSNMDKALCLLQDSICVGNVIHMLKEDTQVEN